MENSANFNYRLLSQVTNSDNMYLLPIYVKRYKANIKADCFVKNIRLNTLYKYDNDGYIRHSNPRGLICRNEKDKTIILRDRPYYRSLMGGVTALMIADGENGDELTRTSIAFHDWAGAIWFAIIFSVGIYGLLEDANPMGLLVAFPVIFVLNALNTGELKRQKDFIERMIKNCGEDVVE
jgi:hypothetical protein